MSKKDEFTFDDNDDFPDTDLSGAFADAEQAAPTSTADLESEPSPGKKRGFGRKKGRSSKKKVAKSGSKSRTLLLLLLLIVIGAAGAYHFMGLGGIVAVTPKTAPPQKAQQSVALPPKPAPAKATAPVPAESAESAATDSEKAEVVTVALPPQPVAQVETKVDEPVTVASAAKEKTAPEPAADDEKLSAPVAAAEPLAETLPEESKALPAEAAPALEKGELLAAAGPYMLDAGSYLLESNRDSLVKKIRTLGYEPQITPVEVKLEMTRLRLGRFSDGEIQEALNFVRQIEPSAFSVRDGSQHVIYAGTYLISANVEKLRKRFVLEGIEAEAVPVKVSRTLSRIRFGAFSSKAAASALIQQASAAGFEATVVKVK